MKDIAYIACFFDPQTLQQLPIKDREGPLYRSICAPHVTFVYAPQEIPTDLFGTKVTVKVVGYGCNGVNEALRVEFVDLPQTLLPLAAEISVPHITLSVAKEGKPTGSRLLKFRPIEVCYLEGLFGGMDTEGILHLNA